MRTFGFLAHSVQPNNGTARGHFYFVDESSLASTRQMKDFLTRLGSQDRVLLIGDTRQHQGVETGRPFEQLQQAGMRTAKLDQIVRQKDPALKSAVELLAQGRSAAALIELRQQGRIQEIPDREERIHAVARLYAASPENTPIVSPDNASRRELNLAVREELRTNGALHHDDHSFRVLVQRQDMTGADRAWANPTPANWRQCLPGSGPRIRGRRPDPVHGPGQIARHRQPRSRLHRVDHTGWSNCCAAR